MNAREVFDSLLTGDAEPGSADLERVCARHPEHELALRDLWAAYKRAAGLIDRVTAVPASSEEGPERYEVRGEIAHGGMGRVLEIWDTELRRTLAMKVLRDEPHAGLDRIEYERHRSRLVNEAQILGQLEHPGIVPIHEVGRDARGRPYFTMLRVRGRALGEIIDDVRAGREGWSTTRAVGVLLRVCEAVAHAHSKGVLHRDLKPSNVMVGPFGEVFVMDWGLAKARGSSYAADLHLREAAFSTGHRQRGDVAGGVLSVHTNRRDASESDPVSPLLTMDGDVVGTPAYMSPEQADGRIDDVDERSDVYGVGAMLYHLLAGHPPYCPGAAAGREEERDAHAPRLQRELLARVKREPPEPLRARAPAASPELAAIAEKAMARVPDRRYPSMVALGEDLRAHLEGRVVKAHRSGALVELGKWVRRHRLLVTLLTLLIATLTASAVGLGLLYRDSEHERLAAERRLGLLRQRVGGMRLTLDGIPSVPSFHDDFEDGILSPRLRIWSHPERIEERDGRLVVERRGHSSEETFLGLDPSSEVIRGDFELSVSYETEGFSVPHRGKRWFGINVRTALERRLVAMVHRFDGWVDREDEPTIEAYETKTKEGANAVYVPATGPSGRLRIARSRARISVSVWQEGTWREIASDETTTGPLTFGLYACGTHGDDGSYLVSFDDLRLVTSAGGELEPVEAFVETFDDGLGPYFRAAELGDGVAGVVEGKVLLEKFPGHWGWVHLEMDWPRCVLRGDFTVDLEYRLEDFRLPEERDGVYFELQIFSVDDFTKSLAALSRFRDRRRDPRDGVSAWTNQWNMDTETRPCSGDAGRFRIRRRGVRFFMEYWDEGWQLLLERDVTAADAFLRLHLAGPEQGVLVTLDDLRIEGLYSSIR